MSVQMNIGRYVIVRHVQQIWRGKGTFDTRPKQFWAVRKIVYRHMPPQETKNVFPYIIYMSTVDKLFIFNFKTFFFVIWKLEYMTIQLTNIEERL